MDKNKSRSDLLKAGRKKLQQFREKKDGKGGGSSSHGKSSKKSSKSEQHQFDTDATSSAAKPAVSSIPEVVDVSHLDSDLRFMDSDSVENSLASEIDVAAADSSSVVITPEAGTVDASLAHDAELLPQESRVGDADSAGLDNKDYQVVEAEEPRATPSAILDAPVLEGETEAEITNLIAASASVDIAEEVAEMDVENRMETAQLLPSQKPIPDASLIQARGDQVTDVGAMQEGDDLGLKKFDRSSESELEGDGKLVLSDLGGSAATLREADAIPSIGHQVENQLKDAVAGLSDEEKSGIPFANYGNDLKEGAQADTEIKTVTEVRNQQYTPEDSSMTKREVHERSFETEMASAKRPGSNAELGNSGLILPEYCHPDSFETLKEELYVANFGKDIFNFQLKEISDLQVEFDHQQHQWVDEISVLRASLHEDQEKRERLAEELANCRSELQNASSRSEELENQVHSVKAEAHEFSSWAHELQISLERSQWGLSNLSVELADCKGLVATLQVENENLKGTVALVTEDGRKLLEEKESCLKENEKLSLELADCKSVVASLQTENSNFIGTLASLTEERKQLEEEKESLANEYATISEELTCCKGLVSALEVENADINRALSLITEERKKLEEDKEYFIQENERLSNELLVLQKNFPSDSEEHKRDDRISSLVLEEPSSDDPHAIVIFKAHLEEAEKIVQNLEKAIEGMNSETMSFNRSSAKIASPRISKLIQAFELKVPHDEHEAEDKSLIEDQLSADPFTFIKEQIGKLRTVLQQLPLDAENADGERDAGESYKVATTDLTVEIEALKKKCDNLEATNIEHGVLYEAVKQHACGVEAKNKELEVQIEALKREDVSLKAEYADLGDKVSHYKSRASELLTQLHDLQRSSDEKTSVMEYQLESLQKEATERALILEQEWESTIAQIIKTTEKLDECIARVSSSAIAFKTDDGLDVNICIGASVNAAIKVIEALQEKLEAALEDHKTVHGSYKEVNEKYNDLVGKNELASVMLYQIYGDLRKLLIDSCGSVDELAMNIQASELVDPLDYANYNTLVEQLENLLGDRQQLHSLNNELNSQLMSRANDIEELNRRCLSLDVIQKLVEDIEGVVNLQNSETDSDITTASHLESLVSLPVQKYKEASELVSTSRKQFSNAIQNLIEDVEGVVNLEHTDTDLKFIPASHLELLLSALVQKYKEASGQVSSSREEFTNTIQKLVGVIESVVILENSETDRDVTPTIRLELLVSLLVQKYKEATEQVNFSTQFFSNNFQKLIGDIEGVLSLDSSETNSDITPALRLELLVSSLVQKYKESSVQVRSSTEEFSNTIQKLVGYIEAVVDLEDTVISSDIAPALHLELLVSSLVQKYKESSVQGSTSTEELLNTIQKLVGDIEAVVNLEDTVSNSDILPALRLELLVPTLVQRYKEVSEKVNPSAEEFSSTIQKSIRDIEGVMDQVNTETSSDITPALHLELLVSSLVQKYKESSVQGSSSMEELSYTIQKLVGDIETVVNLEDTETNSDIPSALRLELVVSSLVQRYKEVSEKVSSSAEEFSSTIQKSIRDIEGVIDQVNTETNSDMTPALRLESLVSSLVQKYKGASEQVCSSSEEFGSKAMELTELQEKMQQLNVLNLEHENEIRALKESLAQEEEALTVARSELQEKTSELEQSDQRVSSIRDKLGIAVGKGKALVVQRESLKQSLAETSKELERCSQELQLKDARLHELETKLKAYLEAGERVEALESELSYIRNSATALRESFLLKDSVLQRIEEIVEELDLPENFHSRGIIEKVEWLARSATGNSLPVNDWDQKSVGGSYSDAGFVVKDAWKEDATPTSSSGDDLRRKYEELQNKFYGLAEQTEMLEQSLMERNHMVQRWEELLDRINMPSHLRSMEPEDRIEWLGTALMEADHDRSSLLQKIDNLENYCGLVTADLEESQKRISELKADLQAVIHEREQLFERLDILTGDHERNLAKVVQFELDNGNLQSKVTGLQEKLAEKVGNEERIQSIEVELHKLEGLVSDALQEPVPKEMVSGECGTECLEALLRKLVEHYSALSMVKPVLGSAVNGIQTTEADDANLNESGSREIIITEKPDVAVLKKDLEEALDNLMHVKVERDVYLEKQQSLISEIGTLDRKREELQEKLIQEEQKSASLREKLIVAVRKGKLLVQQRDSLKQTLEEMNNEIERLKSEISCRENTLVDTEQKIRDLSAYPEMVESLESDKLFLGNRLTEIELVLQEREHVLSSTINALGDIDVVGEITIDDPVEKLKQIGKLLHDLHASLASSEQESRKSRRAAELLLAELNEVQERNDYLQEELVKAGDELAEISKEKDEAEAAKFEALSHLEKLSSVYSEGKQKQYHELMVSKISVNELKNGISDVNSLLADVFSKDLEFLHNLEVNMESCLKQRDTTDVVVGLPILSPYSSITSSNSQNKQNLLSVNSWSGQEAPDHLDDSAIVEISNFVGASLQELKTDIGGLKEKLHEHPISLHETASNLSKVMGILQGEMISQKKSLEALRKDFTQVESVEKEKEMEIFVLRRNISLLYEACANSIMEIFNKKAELVGNNSAVGEWWMSSNPVTSADGELPSGGEAHFNSEEHVKAIADRLSSTLKDFAVMGIENVEGNLKEMKTTIADLQRELQEKDIQKDRICSELVSQIKGAEAAAQSYLQDLQSDKAHLFEMEQQLKVMEEERNLLKQRLKELQNEQATLTELQDKVKSLSDLLPAKDQEIEALMQALDEDETQIDDLKNKIEELEKVLRQKNLDLENVEASRGKIAKKLSVTVNKFDELHYLSERLLAEVEKLQSQLQDRDAEISFLRQEVTRCTNEVLAASQMNKRDSDEIQEILSWVDTMISRTGLHDLHLNDMESSQVQCKELLQKKISAIISEFEDLRVAAQSRDAMLKVEKSKVQELTHKEEALRKSLREKESQLDMLEDVGDLGRENSLTSEILEVEPLINKWTVPGPSTTSQVRSLRKVNNDQVAIAIDTEADGSRLEDEDDDKVHGFKSLTTSRVVPRFTRPVSDMIDGLWVSCDRALMRQPALRLSIIVYWAILHTLLASFVF